MLGYDVKLIYFGHGVVASCCEGTSSEEYSGSINDGEYFDQLSDYNLFTTPWS
jgi:hypothetical protein